MIALLAAPIGLALAALAAFYLPVWSSLGAAAALVGVLLLGGERLLTYALLAAGVVAAAGWVWRRREQRLTRRLPDHPQAATVASPKTKAKDPQREARRRRAA